MRENDIGVRQQWKVKLGFNAFKPALKALSECEEGAIIFNQTAITG